MRPMSCTTKRKSVGHLLLGIWCAILGALLVHSPLQAQTVSLLPMTGTQAADVTVEISQMVRLTNHARAQRGLYPYLLNPVLSQAAQSHVNDMIASGRLGHVGSDGSPRLRVFAARALSPPSSARTGFTAAPCRKPSPGGWQTRPILRIS